MTLLTYSSSLIKKLVNSNGHSLEYIDGFYVDKNLHRKPLPSVIFHHGKLYYRYMDRIFSPTPIKKMEAKQSMLMCEIRLKYFDEFVDDAYNLKVINEFISYIPPNKHRLNILDFGCGNGKYTLGLKSRVEQSEVFGVDISMNAIKCAEKNYPNIFWFHINDQTPLPFQDGYFDFIFSSFVMHFNISKFFICELNRILAKNGKFIFNIYNEKYFSNELFQHMEKSGFRVDEIKPSFQTNQSFYMVKKNK
ncbi:hypothetical protein GCM10011514_30370 [Emticicia aquatilis]|uniref:Methyltransferase type 11 domain-containing protein n=1 Tax=Emticicia aquatilis TaxID=1537369 RepID=A0A916YWA4_9BACT|nr:class I SAM-dependent methyltransferase [Emticicia aquatilis]GGD64340.1 hypothetical protein GCM10011514_30370 [Emticicia aquatilis]